MKTKKAFIKLNGEIGEKEIPCVEYVDTNYISNLDNRKNAILNLLPKKSNNKGKAVAMETKVLWDDPVIVHHHVHRFEDDEETRDGVKQAVGLIESITKDNKTINLLMDFSTTDFQSAYTMSAHKIWAVGFKGNEEIQRLIIKTAILANDSAQLRDEKEFMESEKRKFFTDFQEALVWLKSYK